MDAKQFANEQEQTGSLATRSPLSHWVMLPFAAVN
jgi:hypothetical protein